jgi:hypothetical protein
MLGAISGGVLFLVWGYVHGNTALPTYFDALATVLKFIVPLLFLVGLASLCLQRKGQAGWLGWLGFILCFCGSMWGILDAVVPAGPWIARIVAERGLPGALAWWTSWTVPLLTGLTLIGVDAIVTAKSSQWWDVLPLVIGVFGWVYYVTDEHKVLSMPSLHIATGILFGLGWVALGYTRLSKKAD